MSIEELEQLLRVLEPTINALARKAAKTGGGRHEPNDVAQVLREAIVRDAGAYVEASPPLRFVMLRAVALSHARSSRRRARVELTGLPRAHDQLTATEAEPTMDARDTLDRLSARLAALPPTQLRVVLDVLEGRTSRESAEALGVTEETVRWHRSRAVRSLGEGLADCSLAELEAFAEAMATAVEEESKPYAPWPSPGARQKK